MARPGVTLVAASIVLAAGAVSAADDVVARAMRLYEQHHYEEAAQTLQAGLPALSPAGRASAYLTLGMIYLDNAELHRELSETAITVQLDYLKKLAVVRGAEGSRFANLYLGKALLESGEAREAAKYLERFSAQPGIPSRYRAIAGASLGLSHFVGNNAQAARAQWASVDTADPEVQMALAAAYSRAGLKDRDPVAMGEAALRKAGASPSPRLLESLLTVYARAGLTDRGLELVRQADLKEASYTEAGEVERSQRAFSTFLALPTAAPPPQRNRARVRYATGQYLQGQRGEAMAVWDGLAQEQSADPELLAEILSACARVRAGCAGVESRAARASEAGEGRKTRALNIALGRLYLRRGDYGQAITYLEAGRDKSRKNRIESNDPLMLVNLAAAYYRGRQFSEGLEIYFEMSKHYPVVRRIQDAMQGMYAVEQKSAGDVRIF